MDVGGNCNSSMDDDFDNSLVRDPFCWLWTKRPASVKERRQKFLRWMGLNDLIDVSDCSSNQDGGPACWTEFGRDVHPIMSKDGAATANCCSDDEVPASVQSKEDEITSKDQAHAEVYNGLSNNRTSGCSSKRSDNSDDPKRGGGRPTHTQPTSSRDDHTSNGIKTRRKKSGLLNRLGAISCIAGRGSKDSELSSSHSKNYQTATNRRVRVQLHKKRLKEFSAVYMGQDINAHDGPILTMKFSPHGQYLASGGEDGIVKVWHVRGCHRLDEAQDFDYDPSCDYFIVNRDSELVPLSKNKKTKGKNLRRLLSSTCVIIPPHALHILEEPVHNFQEHHGEVLDLSWSNDKYLLSSSTDYTVRLWQVGCDRCIKVFSHNNYVTTVQFNPVNEEYFVSGSIDGKVRIWKIQGCQVVDWIDVREIITAVCYFPDGKGVAVGLMNGECRFYDASGMKLFAIDCSDLSTRKKRYPYRRITGFQFSPCDQRKVMVSSADCQVRILEGTDVICKYRGLQKAGSQVSASFTTDGRHIVLASEDSTLYIWSHHYQGVPLSIKKRKSTTWSCEHFVSHNALIAVPWNGLGCGNLGSATSGSPHSHGETSREQIGIGERNQTPDRLSTRSTNFLTEFLRKGLVTWPEEKLYSKLISPSSLSKSLHNILRSSYRNNAHAWGQVIVTAGCDGQIRSFQNYGLPVHLQFCWP